jgi:DNA-binding transcriptional ArsR family regulator
MVVCQENAGLDRVFRALADSTRRDIVSRTLVGPVSVSGLAGDYAMSFAAVQKHVAVLEKAGLVCKQVAGRERLVTAVPEEIARARACLEQLEALWRHRITALDAVLSQPQE